MVDEKVSQTCLQVQHPCENETTLANGTTPKNETIQKNETKQTSGCEHSDAGKYIGLSDLFCEVDIYLSKCHSRISQVSQLFLLLDLDSVVMLKRDPTLNPRYYFDKTFTEYKNGFEANGA